MESRPSEAKYPHIQVMAGNTQGCDHIAGDVHGSYAAFEEMLQDVHFENGDRLFLAGDLNDKGPFSLKVIQRIMEINKAAGKTVIFVTRGNHEQTLIEYYDAFMAYRKLANTA